MEASPATAVNGPVGAGSLGRAAGAEPLPLAGAGDLAAQHLLLPLQVRREGAGLLCAAGSTNSLQGGDPISVWEGGSCLSVREGEGCLVF